ncbi:hypothetical protein K503DRAFT_806460 [Rhizopogon vinicolor AM-OR11-026]|uniref:Uncharacterized protein n=1 Tax=Rhizopogon vinicolor AM-OR11-026 TaxID=1314800 RepID=A0A1B7MEH9_9AGAM|nr:hypothetical protein K503DRAFT_806460 [Rhizopogon vinicolor AM-OR11-026]
MGLGERLKRPFRIHAPANSNQGERTPEARVGGGEERGKDVDLYPCSANITPCAVHQNNDKSKQREEPPAGTNTPPPDDTLPPAALDSDDNRKLWKSIMGVQGKGTASHKKSPANMTYNSSSEVVEVYAARGFQKQQRTCKWLVTGGYTFARWFCIGAYNITHGDWTARSISTCASELFITTYDADDGSDSDSIQGEWNKFLVKICYPCGCYDDT